MFKTRFVKIAAAIAAVAAVATGAADPQSVATAIDAVVNALP